MAEQVARYGADLSLTEWAARLRCTECCGREAWSTAVSTGQFQDVEPVQAIDQKDKSA